MVFVIVSGEIDLSAGSPLGLLGVFTLMARRTVFGRRIHAIGGNLAAIRLSGINVQRYQR